MVNEIIINGIANPNEKMPNKNVPCNTVVVLAASNRTLPNIGPIQGVHPNANTAPKINADKGLPGFNLSKT